MLDFENPAAFVFLLFIPVLYILRHFKFFVPISFPLILADWNGSEFKWNKKSRNFFSLVSRVLIAASYVCVVIAFADPVIHHQEKVYNSRGSDILFVVDVSPSMAAIDIGGKSRIKAAQEAILTIAKENQGNSIGLVEMAKNAAVVVPPTMDRKVFYDKLQNLAVGEMGDGTALGIGISCAVLHLESSTAPKKSIVLITDGENNAGSVHPNTAARMAKSNGISLYILGLGTTGSVPLEYVDPNTGKIHSGYLNSQYDAEALNKIALEGDGKFYEVTSMNSLSQVLSSINKNETVVQNYQIKNVDSTYYREFLYIAVILIVVSWLIKRLFLQEIL